MVAAIGDGSWAGGLGKDIKTMDDDEMQKYGNGACPGLYGHRWGSGQREGSTY